ncbi:hypothetical protein NBRC10512_000045 [Rhodotorula toruloides]|uniref:RHTO0S09e04566g1_1 n=2 Tax=Rhodotorula toruloides TaxID=5286 RepID=A0A061B3R4_RHOTO|nr:glucooligosaccharide oxidase [Rhodotorula toruloides NP11]EMS22860.1 glucooligosaccharide oxidase [Rhodotorula toruloides NP11]CDR44461.1 RHTO0S09e04566g1_1 [Rhodotorula toruloides]
MPRLSSWAALPLLLATAPSSLAAPLLAARQSNPKTLDSCLQNAGLSPVTTSSTNWDRDSAAYNQRLEPTPTAILYPLSQDEISSALSCAAQSGFSVSARGGGHSYASYSLGGTDGALVIDLGNLVDISVDSNGVAAIGGGSRLGDIYLALDKEGWAVAAGVCNGVGIGGHAGFGGFGYPSRMWGLLSDQVVGYDVVLANGTALTNLTRDQNPDLFWALNGAAPNYGIVTKYYVQAHHKPATAVVFSYTYNSPSTVNAATAFESFASFGNTSAPANLGITATIGSGSIEISGVWYGPRAEFDGVIQPLLDELLPPDSSDVEAMSWIDSATKLAGVDDLATNGKMLQSRDSFYAKSIMTPSTIPVSVDVLESFFDYLWHSGKGGDTNWFVEVNTYGGANSAINNVSLADSSFGFRDKHLTFQLYASSSTYGNPYPDDGVSFVQGMYDTVVDGMTAKGWSNNSSSPDGYAGYVNYVDPQLTFDQVKNLYWGSQYNKLSALKAQYDPQQLLNRPQGIQPSSS